MWEVKTPCGCSMPIGQFVEGMVIAKTGIRPLGKFAGNTVEFITCKQNIPLLFSLAVGSLSTARILVTDEESIMHKIVKFSGFTFIGMSFGYLAYTYSTSSSSESEEINHNTSLIDVDYLDIINLGYKSIDTLINYNSTNPPYCSTKATVISDNGVCNIPKKQINYKPFALSANVLDLNIIKTTSLMKGTPENDLMIADENGSSIFAIGGLNYMIAGPGSDKFYFSLCSTDIIDGKVGVIEGFDIDLDKIDVFCTKTDVYKHMITIFHNQVDGRDYTYIQVCGQEKCSAISLVGNIPLTVDDIVLNDRWDMVAG